MVGGQQGKEGGGRIVARGGRGGRGASPKKKWIPQMWREGECLKNNTS